MRNLSRIEGTHTNLHAKLHILFDSQNISVRKKLTISHFSVFPLSLSVELTKKIRHMLKYFNLNFKMLL